MRTQSNCDLSAWFDIIYTTDLLYGKACWTLCKDAHCCSFGRYKQDPQAPIHQSLLLLPGEYAYMRDRGFLQADDGHRHIATTYRLSRSELRAEYLIRKTMRGACGCTRREMRPTTCRLYPMLPLFEVGLGLVGIERHYALEDEVEKAAGMEPSCQVSRISPRELTNFLSIAEAIAAVPNWMFHVMAYDTVRRHVQRTMSAQVRDQQLIPTPEGVAQAMQFLGAELAAGELFDAQELVADLESLSAQFVDCYGVDFQSIGSTGVGDADPTSRAEEDELHP